MSDDWKKWASEKPDANAKPLTEQAVRDAVLTAFAPLTLVDGETTFKDEEFEWKTTTHEGESKTIPGFQFENGKIVKTEARPFVRKGEQVVVNGRLICEAKRDIESGETADPDQFQWFITPPARGEAMDNVPGFQTRREKDPVTGFERIYPQVLIAGEWRG